MLQDLRDQKNSWLIVLLFAIIIIVFIFMFGLPGMDSVVSKNHSSPGKVGSHEITHDMLRSMVLQRYDDSVLSSNQYPSVAYAVTEGIATVYLLADAARNAGLRVSDQDLQDYITNWEMGNPDVMRLGFLQNNKFSKDRYERMLANLGWPTRDYEDYKREELLASRYLTLMISSISVSDATLWAQFAEENASASLEFVRLTPNKIRDTFADITEEEVAAFIAASAADIQTYYDEHIGDYTTLPKAKLHQVVIQKNPMKLTNPGAKTIKTYQPGERFAIARAQILEKNLDFAQAFADYDESEDKELQGITGLLGIDIMAPELQTALDGKKVGDIVTAELSDRFVIAKILEQTDKVVKPLDEVRNEIALKLIDSRRIAARTKDVSDRIIAAVQVQGEGKSLATALNDALYSDVLLEQPVIVVPVEMPEIHEDPDDPNSPLVEVEQPEPIVVPVETDQRVIPEEQRIQVGTVASTSIDTSFLQGLGVNEDLARDIRAAAPGTFLTKTYPIGLDTVIVRVVDKKGASHEAFVAQFDKLRNDAIAKKTAELIGDPAKIVYDFSGGRGVWVQQIIENAKVSGDLVMNDAYFQALVDHYKKREEARNADK